MSINSGDEKFLKVIHVSKCLHEKKGSKFE